MLKLTVKTSERCEMVNITSRLRSVISENRIVNGLLMAFVPHTTAGITVNEAYDPDVCRDLLAKLEQMVPHHEDYYRHAEGNSDSHLKASMMGSSVTLIVGNSELKLGRWQGVFFCEFDGPRTRQVYVQTMTPSL